MRRLEGEARRVEGRGTRAGVVAVPLLRARLHVHACMPAFARRRAEPADDE